MAACPASSAGHVDVVRYLLSQAIPADHAYMGTATPLHVASQEGYLGVVRLLRTAVVLTFIVSMLTEVCLLFLN